MLDLLCLGKSSGQSHAKLRISHSRGIVSGEYPLAILDGPEAFFVNEHLDNGSNVLVILDRSEYQEGINNQVLQLKSNADDQLANYVKDIPDSFPPGVEFEAFVVDRY